jgi:hypothetical protein
MKWVEANPDVNGFGGGGGPEWIEVRFAAGGTTYGKVN